MVEDGGIQMRPFLFAVVIIFVSANLCFGIQDKKETANQPELDKLIHRAFELLLYGKMEEAEKAFSETINYLNRHGDSQRQLFVYYGNLGLIQSFLYKYLDGEANYKLAIKLIPAERKSQLSDLYFGLGSLYAVMFRFRDSEAAFLKCHTLRKEIKCDQDQFATLYYELGYIYLESNKLADAERCCRLALTAGWNHEPFIYGARKQLFEVLLRKKETKSALDMLNKAFDVYPREIANKERDRSLFLSQYFLAIGETAKAGSYSGIFEKI